MYSLFTRYQRPQTGEYRFPEFDTLEKGILQDISRIAAHYENSTYAAKSTHLLCRLILNMNIPITYPADVYYNIAVQQYESIAAGLGIGSSSYRPKWSYGMFYYECPELIFAGESSDRFSEVLKGINQVSAVKVLEHPVSNMGYLLPNGVNHSSERGLAAIYIDVPRLMLQYYFFSKDQIQKKMDGLSHLGVTHFLYQKVFPRMLRSQTDIMIFNRLINLKDGLPMGQNIRRHPFMVPDRRGQLDVILEKTLKRFKTTNLYFSDIIRQTPTLYSDYFLSMPDMALTDQVWWALFASRLKAIKFLVSVGGEATQHLNKTWMNELFVDLKELRQTNVYPSRLDKSISYDVMDDIAYLTALVHP